MTPAELQKLLDTDPRAIQQFSRSRLLGIGGYYLITKTSHQISAQGGRLTWTTEATTRWDTFGKTPEAFIPQAKPAFLGARKMAKRLNLRKLQEEAKMQELANENLAKTAHATRGEATAQAAAAAVRARGDSE